MQETSSTRVRHTAAVRSRSDVARRVRRAASRSASEWACSKKVAGCNLSNSSVNFLQHLLVKLAGVRLDRVRGGRQKYKRSDSYSFSVMPSFRRLSCDYRPPACECTFIMSCLMCAKFCYVNIRCTLALPLAQNTVQNNLSKLQLVKLSPSIKCRLS